MRRESREIDGEGKDAYFLLCKKVAQLTRVIFMLNSRNEEAEGRLEELRERYEEQIRNAEQQAARTIAALQREASEGEKSRAEALRKEVDALSNRYESQKREALASMEEWKLKLRSGLEEKVATSAHALRVTEGEMRTKLDRLEGTLSELPPISA